MFVCFTHSTAYVRMGWCCHVTSPALWLLGSVLFHVVVAAVLLVGCSLQEEAAAAAAESDEEKTPAKTPEEQAAYEEAMIDVELEDLSAEAKKRAKRLRKKQRAAHQKQLRRVALGMSKQAVDLVQDPNLFTLKTFKDAQELEEAAEVNLSKPSKAVARAIAAGGEMSSDSESDVAEPSDLDSDEEAARCVACSRLAVPGVRACVFIRAPPHPPFYLFCLALHHQLPREAGGRNGSVLRLQAEAVRRAHARSRRRRQVWCPTHTQAACHRGGQDP